MVQADTLEELADKVVSETVSGDKFNANGFLKTVNEWNDAVANDTTGDLEFPVSSATRSPPRRSTASPWWLASWLRSAASRLT